MRVVTDGDDYTLPGNERVGVPLDPRLRGLMVQLQRVEGLTRAGLLVKPFVFQVPPLDQFSRQYGYNWTDYDTVSAGQYSRPTGRQLSTISFDTLFTLDDDPYYTLYDPLDKRGMDPLDMVQEMRDILYSGTPFKLIAAEMSVWTHAEIRMLATLRSLTVTERGGEPDARYANVSFTEYRDPSVVLRQQGRGGANSRVLPISIPLRAFHPSTYPQAAPRPPTGVTTLRDLAAHYYGAATKWTKISGANAWMKGIEPSHDLGLWNTDQLKKAAASDRKIVVKPDTSKS